MFKTALRVTTAFGVLLAAYAGYTRVFALVAAGLGTAKDPSAFVHVAQESRTQKIAKSLAIKSFGLDHWASEDKLPIRIYNAERGFYIYARDYERLNEGKTIVFTPFALIWVSKDGKSLKTVTSHSATVDLDQPFTLAPKPGSSGGNMKVVHARVEGDVHLRDDKTTANPDDDLRISGLSYIDYDDKTLNIIADDNDTVVIEDLNYRAIGKGLLIKLRPNEGNGTPGSNSGFNGAQSAILKKDVFITLFDVGPGGMLPGNTGVKRVKGGTPVPLTARSDGMLKVDLPKPRILPRVGPPPPHDPTFAHFQRNVEVVRGKAGMTRDMLYCDNLHLTLLPPKKDHSETPKTPAPSEDELFVEGQDEAAASSEGGLTLKEALADGHNVRLLSTAQGIKARCKQLIHKKLMPEAPDETYLLGDATRKVIVEKTDIAQEGPDKGKVTGFSTIRTIDVKIFDNGLGNDYATIVARGPGDLESRPRQDGDIERTAHWLDQLTLQPELLRDKSGNPLVTGKRLTLTGTPGFADIPAAAKLDARDLIVVFLKPNGKTDTKVVDAVAVQDTKPKADKDPAVERTSYQIERLFARNDVRLDAPSRTLVAREWLDAQFESRESSPPAVSAVAASTPVAQAEPGPNAVADPNAKAAEPAAKPANPQAKATANRVSAKILLHPGAGQKGTRGAGKPAGSTSSPVPGSNNSLIGGSNSGTEIKKVMLRGAVTFHQDPSPGKTRGTDAVGEAIDIDNRGPDIAKFVIFHNDPASKTVAARPAKSPAGTPAPAAEDIDADLIPLARIDMDDMTFRGEVIGLDQSTNEAWIDGRGSLTKLAAVGLLSDKGLPGQSSPAAKPGSPRGLKPVAEAAPVDPKAPTKTTPMTISFDSRMKFFGYSTNLLGRPVARAEFYKNVHAETDESIMDCKDVMRVYFDRTVKLAQAKNPNAKEGEAEPKPEIATIECIEDVVVINEKLYPNSKQVLQKQRIEGDNLVYEKLTGKFHMNSSGIVYLYEREGQGGQALGAPGGAARPVAPAVGGGNARVIRPTSGPGQNGQPKPPVIGRNSVPNPAEIKSPARGGVSPLQSAIAATPLPPLILTQVRFAREMTGRFGSGKQTDKAEVRWADFFGEVEALRGRVQDAESILDPDRRPQDGQFLTSEILRVVSEPNAVNPDGPPRYLMAAWENAFAADYDKTIQADRITYDTTSNLFYAYGDEGREVLISQQPEFGQPSSYSRAGGVRYNAKTGQSSLIDLKAGSMIQARTGTRPTPVSAPGAIAPKHKPRTPFRNPRNFERKDFTGK